MPASEKRLVRALAVLILVTDAIQFGIGPLLPQFAVRLGMSSFEVGLMVAVPSLMIVVTGWPAGSLTTRFGPRRVTVCAAVLSATAVLQPLMPTFPLLALLRAVDGVAVALVWVAGAAWVSERLDDHQAALAMAQFMAAAAFGVAAGPVVAGLLTGAFGLVAPFAAATALSIWSLVIFILTAGGRPAATARWHGVFGVARQGWRAGAGSGLWTLFVSTLVGSSLGVVIPLELHRGGLSAPEISLVFGVAAVLFVGGSWVAGLAGVHGTRVSTLLALIGLLMFALVPAAITGAAAAAAVALMLVAPLRGGLNGLAFPLARREAGPSVTAEAVMAFLLPIWAMASVVGPGFTGVLYGIGGSDAAIVGLELVIAAVVLVIATTFRRRQVCV